MFSLESYLPVFKTDDTSHASCLFNLFGDAPRASYSAFKKDFVLIKISNFSFSNTYNRDNRDNIY